MEKSLEHKRQMKSHDLLRNSFFPINPLLKTRDRRMRILIWLKLQEYLPGPKKINIYRGKGPNIIRSYLWPPR